MNTMKKIVTLAVVTLLAALILGGCGVKRDSNPPSQNEVENAVKKETMGERVALNHVEHLDQIPKKDIYYYKSLDRDLEFQVESYIRTADIGIGGQPINTYSKEITIHYWDAIKESYEPELAEIFSDATKQGINYTYYFQDFAELEKIAAKVEEAEECFAEEMKYHDDMAWLRNRVAVSVGIRFDLDETDEKGNPVYVSLFPASYPIYAYSKPEEAYDKICGAYVGKILSGAIPLDNTVPAEILALGHKDKLTKVIINGTEMTDELSFMLNMTPSVVVNDVFYAEYNYDYGCYMMRIDPGCGSKSSRCHPLQAIVKAAGGNGADKCSNNSKEEWDINGDHFVIIADRDPGVSFIKGVTLTKNGKPMDITYTNRTDFTRSSDMIMVSIEDLANMLGMTVTVDEDGDTVVFE